MFIRALQSDHFIVIVESCKKIFKVSQDLLIQCSSFFKKLCSLSFKKSIEQVINLSENDLLIFEDFFIWLHSFKPYISFNNDESSLINLDVFVEKYQVHLLTNHIFDLIRKTISESRWKSSSNMMRTMYDDVSVNSILRCLCALDFTVSLSKINHCMNYSIWKTVFIDFANLEWNYFCHTLKEQTSIKNVTSQEVCYFHDHSDVFDWVRQDVNTCSFFEEASIAILNQKDVLILSSDSESLIEKLWLI